MNTCFRKELDKLIATQFIGKKILNHKDFSGCTIQDAFIKIGIDYEIQLNLSFKENNNRLILSELEEIELE